MTLVDTEHILLVLPFTTGLLRDPSSLLGVVFTAAQHATKTVTVAFVTPGEEQLYPSLLAAPKAHWDKLQHFLGKVYSALAAGHWAADRILVDVEVRFQGEGEWSDRVLARPDRLVVLDSFSDLGDGIVAAIAPGIPKTTVPTPTLPPSHPLATPSERTYAVSAVGGTFDHLHAAHKLLLHIALFICEKRLVVGMMADSTLTSKSNAAMVEKLDVRIEAVHAFLRRCGLHGRIPDVVEMTDGLGPTAWDPEITAIAVSRETMSGANKVNEVRAGKGLGILDVLCVDVISSSLETDSGEDVLRTVDLGGVDGDNLKQMKMGSTAIRDWMAKR